MISRVPFIWSGHDVDKALNLAWCNDKVLSTHLVMPLIMIWSVWLARNSKVKSDYLC